MSLWASGSRLEEGAGAGNMQSNKSMMILEAEKIPDVFSFIVFFLVLSLSVLDAQLDILFRNPAEGAGTGENGLGSSDVLP
jgi:hypothetical protein